MTRWGHPLDNRPGDFPTNSRHRRLAGLIVLLLAAAHATGATPPENSPWIPVCEIAGPRDTVRLYSPAQLAAEGLPAASGQPLFRALPPGGSFSGATPVYSVEIRGLWQLRRHAPRGQESTTEPAFLALPLEDEPDVSRIAGPWTCIATRPGTSRAWFGWEFAAETNQVSGRFEPSSDYRFAHLTSGSFRSNHLELIVDYVNDRFLLFGEWRDDTLTGTWRRTDDAEDGTWEARRPNTPRLAVPPDPAVPLYEWRRESDGARRYLLPNTPPPAGWIRQPRPVCRVWPP